MEPRRITLRREMTRVVARQRVTKSQTMLGCLASGTGPRGSDPRAAGVCAWHCCLQAPGEMTDRLSGCPQWTVRRTEARQAGGGPGRCLESAPLTNRGAPSPTTSKSPAERIAATKPSRRRSRSTTTRMRITARLPDPLSGWRFETMKARAWTVTATARCSSPTGRPAGTGGPASPRRRSRVWFGAGCTRCRCGCARTLSVRSICFAAPRTRSPSQPWGGASATCHHRCSPAAHRPGLEDLNQHLQTALASRVTIEQRQRRAGRTATHRHVHRLRGSTSRCWPSHYREPRW